MALPAPIGVQKEVVALPATGHVVVLGTAGSGKTTMAIHRAAFVSDPMLPNAGRTLLVTFNKTLIRYLDFLVPPELARRVDVRNYHHFARGYLATRGRMGFNWILKDDGERNPLIELAVENTKQSHGDEPLLNRPLEFFSSEIRWMNQHGIIDRDAYVEAERVGRNNARLTREDRPLMHEVYCEYVTLRRGKGKHFDWDDIAIAVREELEQDDGERMYKHIVVDEGQDFSPEMIRSLALAIPADGSLTFFGDVAQQIYGRRLSWSDAGLQVSGVWPFKKNYRNSPQIAALGLAIAAMPYYADEPDMVAPDEFAAAGPKPTLVRFTDEAAELAFVAAQAKAAATAGQSVGILVRRHRDERRVARLVRGAQLLGPNMTWRPGAGISYGTIYAGKGLEFDTVLLPLLSNAHLPDPTLVEAVGADEAAASDGRLLYVGVTRARQNLILSTSGDLTALLPDDPRLWAEVKP